MQLEGWRQQEETELEKKMNHPCKDIFEWARQGSQFFLEVQESEVASGIVIDPIITITPLLCQVLKTFPEPFNKELPKLLLLFSHIWARNIWNG